MRRRSKRMKKMTREHEKTMNTKKEEEAKRRWNIKEDISCPPCTHWI